MWRPSVNERLSRINADLNRSKTPRLSRQPANHQTMHLQQILQGVRIDPLKKRICGLGVLYLFNFLRRTKHAFAVNDVRHLLKGQRILFDGKGRVNGLQSVFLAQKRVDGALTHFKVRGNLGYLGDKRNHLVAQRIVWHLRRHILYRTSSDL